MWKRQRNETSATRIRIKNRYKFSLLTASSISDEGNLMLGHNIALTNSGKYKLPLARLALVLALLLLAYADNLRSSWASGANETATALKHRQGEQVGPSDEGLGGRQSPRSLKDIATKAKTKTQTQTDDGHGAKPPRGYCVRISRAIKPTSRCYKHLVEVAQGHQHQLNSHAEQQQQWARFAQEATQAAARSTNNGGESQRRPIVGAGAKPEEGRRRHEELVYVRSETLGDKITNLSIQAINEYLINGLLDRVMGERRKQAASVVAGAGSNWHDEEKARMQIMGLLPSGCQLAIEKFLCRLVYPSCHFRSIDVVALVRPPCREDCLLLREHICASLNWTQFSQTVQRAFKATLMSTINALDLLVDGDPAADPSLLGDLLSSSRSSGGDDTDDNDATKKNNASSRQRPVANPVSSPSAPGWSALNHISSSIHFYWPHERSIERCESLPILWPPAHVGADFGRKWYSGPGERSVLEVKQLRRWLRDHRTRGYWPVCSSAHLTNTNEINHDETENCSSKANKSAANVSSPN